MGDILTARHRVTSDLGYVLDIAALTIRETWRRKFLTIALGLGAAFLALFGVGLYFLRIDILREGPGPGLVIDTGYNMVVMMGLYVVSFLGIMAGVLTAVPAMAGELASHTADVLAVKPVRRALLALGKWLGLACVVALYVGLLSAGTIGVCWAIGGVVPPNPLRGIALIVLEAIVLMSITLAGGTRLSVVANGALSLGLYGLAFIGGWLEQIGSFTHNGTVVDIGIVTSLLVPSEAMWKMASYSMQRPFVRDLGLTPFSVAAPPSNAMLIYTIVYVAAMVVTAAITLERRDL